jgi:hypothetical protein
MNRLLTPKGRRPSRGTIKITAFTSEKRFSGCSAVLHPDPKGEPTMKTQTTLKTDIYTRVTNKILADLEQGVRTQCH